MSSEPQIDALRVLVFAPVGRDAALTHTLLARAGIAAHVCTSVAQVCSGIEDGAGAILLTEEALGDPHIANLTATLEAQPPWSDISVLLFAGNGWSAAAARTLRHLEVLRNVTLLDRPIRLAAVVSSVHTALRGRGRQYEMRDVLLALHAARTEAEDANRLKDEFLAMLSHEMRTPINAILGWVAMLRQSQVPPPQVPKVLEIVERNARTQAQLIADVLDVSRMITGRIRLQLERVPVANVVIDSVDSVRPAADAKRLTIETHVSTETSTILGDVERLQQIFWNLLSNAIKFTPDGGRIDVSVALKASSVEIEVADTGIGLSKEFLPYAFDRFRQADQTFTRAHGGLGLGLAIVKNLVEMHGGAVVGFSEGVGRGATFRVSLPVSPLVRQPGAGVAVSVRSQNR